MNYFTDENHPNTRDQAQGTTIYFLDSFDDEELIEILTWTRYSSATGEFNATKARFSVDEENKTLHLEHVSIKRKYSSWDDFLTNPRAWISDTMKRVLHDFIAKKKGSQYWRIQLFKE